MTRSIIFDLSEDDEEHEKNITDNQRASTVIVEIKVCAGGNINRFEDIKKIYLYRLPSGNVKWFKTGTVSQLAEEASKRFGKDRILVSVKNVDFIFKTSNEAMEENFHEMLVLDKTSVLDAVENITDDSGGCRCRPDYDIQEDRRYIKAEHSVRGITGQFVTDPEY